MNLSLNNQVSQLKPLFAYLKKQQENQRFMRSVEITATFILISFFMFFAIRPTVLTISSLLGDIQSKQLLKTQLKTKINNVVAAQETFSQVQEKYQIIDDSLPDRPQFFEAANQIQKTGNNSGLSINSLDYNFPPNEKQSLDSNVKLYTISLNIDGQFSSAVKLVSDLLKNRRLINISSIGIGVTEVSSNQIATPSASQGGVSTNFTANFYYWSPPSNQ
jgi:Tfp pilus assembly protein PilO